MTKQKRRPPQRTCVVCREVAAKRELTRLVRLADGRVQVDPTGKLSGRGAYVCGEKSCWQQATAGKILNKALRTPLSDEDRETIKTYFEAR